MILSPTHIRRLTDESVPDARWNPEAIDELRTLAEKTVKAHALVCFERTKKRGKVTVTREDAAPRKKGPSETSAWEEYLLWHEEALQRLSAQIVRLMKEKGLKGDFPLDWPDHEKPERPTPKLEA